MLFDLETRTTTQCPDGGSWYQCAATQEHPQFAGCCIVDACRYGCSGEDNRTPNSNGSPSVAASFSTLFTSVSTSSAVAPVETIASISDGRTILVTVVGSSEYTSPPSTGTVFPNRHINSDANAGAIAGGTLGGLVLLVAAVCLLFILRRKQRERDDRRATLPPTYIADTFQGDMSEQLPSVVAANSNRTEAITSIVTTRGPSEVHQLDSTTIFPANEAITDALGNIPELPANNIHSTDPFITPTSSNIILKTSEEDIDDSKKPFP